MPDHGIWLCPTITKIPPAAAGGVVVSGSHGGAYAGYLAARSGARAVILNDAGVGLDGAGLGALALCERIGMAAATVAHDSARIGDAEDMHAAGMVSFSNALAAEIGVKPGMRCRDAARRLTVAAAPWDAPEPYAEARAVCGRNAHGLRMVCVDSISLVEAGDAGQVVLSGSHGGLVAGQHALAIKVPAAAAFYNDAGVGAGGAGITRLPALDARGIAAATVGAATARIGDGRSTYLDGIVSHVNATAARLGIAPGMAARDAAERVRPRPKSP